MKGHMSIPGFYKRFSTEDICKSFIIQERWNGSPVCPYCGHDKIYDLAGGMPFKCSSCKARFSVRTGTVMEGSRLPLQTWLLAIYMMTTARKGISSVQFAKELGVTQKTAWFLANRIREACTGGHSPLSGEIEIDETYIGGKEHNKHRSKRQNKGRGCIGKQAVLGMRERGGAIRAMPISKTDAATLHSHVNQHIAPASTILTDEHGGYRGLEGYTHKTVKHSAGEYVNGMASTNGIESFWALLKRGYVGTHHWWSVKHLRRYVAEYQHRQNTIGLPSVAAIATLVRNSQGKRLLYADLIRG